MTPDDAQAYEIVMQEEVSYESAKAIAKQAIIRWKDAIMRRKFPNARAWALAAGIDPTTITRTMKPGCKSTASVETLHSLAKAAGVRSVVDFLIDQAEGRDEALPNVNVLTATFAMLLDSLGVDPYANELARKIALQFPDALRSFVDLHERAKRMEGVVPAEVAESDDVLNHRSD